MKPAKEAEMVELTNALQEAHASLASTEDDVPIDFVPLIREQLARQAVRQPPSNRKRMWLAGAAAAAALAIVLPPRDEWRAKSGDVHRWAGIRVYRATDGHIPSPVEGEMYSGDALLFSYRNAGSRPYRHLMIYGVDMTNRIFWYYPEGGEEQAALSIPIAPASDSMLPDATRFPLAPGPYVLTAVFSYEPLTSTDMTPWTLPVAAEVHDLVIWMRP